MASEDPVRVDKWLWAARLIKTRPLASETVKGGRVQVNGVRVKPSKEVRPGDEVELTRDQGRRLTVVVRATAERRESAAIAATLFDETAESIAERERLAAQREFAAPPIAVPGPRPTKRDRRRLDDVRRRTG